MFEESVESSLAVMLASSERADTVKAHVDRAEDLLQTARGTAEQRFAEVEAALEALRQRTDEAKGQIHQEFEEAATRVASFAELVSSEAAEFEQRIADLEAHANDLAEDAERFGTDLIAALTEFAGTVEEVKGQCAELMDALAAEADETVQFFQGEFQSMLDETGNKLQERTEALSGYLTDEVIPDLEEKAQNLGDELKQAGERMKEALESGQQEVHTGVETSLEHVRSSFEEEGVAALSDRSEKLGQDSESSGRRLIEIGEKAATAKDTLMDAVETTNVGIEAAVGALREIRLLLEEVAGMGSE